MRVLLVSWEYPPVVHGGLGRHVRKLAERLADRGDDVHVLTPGAGEHPEREERDGVHVHRVADPVAAAGDLDAFVAGVLATNERLRVAGAELAETHGIDLVHGHDWLVGPAAEALAVGAGVPFLATIHATEFGRHQGWIGKHPQSFIHRTEARMAKRADAVITCSGYMRDHVVDVFGVGAGRVNVIPNGVDAADVTPVADPAALRARFAAPDDLLVLLVGRLVHEKGFQLALDALPGVLEHATGDVRFLVAGTGIHEAALRAQATRLGLDEHGTFLGWIGDDVLRSLYAISDVCVVPSLYEPFGIVALEAMAAGCPCLAADTGGLREVVPAPQAGLRFRAGDARSLQRELERLLGDADLRAAVAVRAAEHVRRYDWDDVAAATTTLYERLVPAAAGV